MARGHVDPCQTITWCVFGDQSRPLPMIVPNSAVIDEEVRMLSDMSESL